MKIKKNSLNSTLETALHFSVLALLFFLPTHFFLKWESSTAYVRGLLIDYLLPKLYATDLLVMCVVFFGLVIFGKKLLARQTKLIVWQELVSLNVVVAQLRSPYPVSSLVTTIRIGLMISLVAVLEKVKTSLNQTWILVTLLMTLFFQAGLGLYQFLTQKSLVGYEFLGEVSLNAASGLATASFGGVEKVLPYGTTAHPNVLAGVLAVYIVWCLSFLSKIQKFSAAFKVGYWLSIGLGLVTLFFTQSLSGWLALGLGLFLVFSKKIPSLKMLITTSLILIFLVPFLLHVAASVWPTNSSLTRRDHLNQSAWQLWLENPLWGSGLSTNAAVGENLSALREPVRFAQPVHHLPLLWLSETGLIGYLWLGLLLAIFIPTWSHFTQLKPWWLMLVPIAALDHYLLTTNAGLLLVVFVGSSFLEQSTRQTTTTR